MKEELRDLTFYGHEYGQWLEDLKQRYLSQRMRATVAVNSALLEFYWSVGKDISENQKDGNTYGSKFYERLSQDLCADLPNVKGLSATNLQHNWSRAVLLNFLDTDLYEHQGKAITNFKEQLPIPQGELAQELTKDPYNFDFLTLTPDYKERELEEELKKKS